jgi:DNA-binding phage protein
MNAEHDLSKRKSRKNPYASKLQKPVTMQYDVAAQLRTPEEIAAYLDAWLDEAPDDAAGIARAVVDVARAKDMAHTPEKPR